MAFSGGYSPLAAAAALGGLAATELTQSSRFDNSNTLDYTHVVTPGPITITGASLFNNTNTFYAPQVNLGLVQNGPYNWFGSSEWSPILSPDPDTFYSATISTTVALTATLFTNTNDFYAADVALAAGGSQDLTPSLYTNSPTFYSASISTLVTINQGTTFSDGDTFHSPTVSLVLTQGARFDNSPSFYAPSLSLVLTQATRAENTSIHYAPSLNLGLTQGTRFDNSPSFYGPSISLVLTQGTRFDNANSYYAASVNLVLSQNATFNDTDNFYAAALVSGSNLAQNTRLDNTQNFFAPQVDLVLLGNLATNTSEFFGFNVAADGADQPLTQTARAENTQTFYGSNVFLDQILVPLRSENANAFYGPALRNQYPDPSFVLLGTQYGEPGLEFTGTYVQTLDKSIKVDVVGGKLVKLINNKVALTF